MFFDADFLFVWVREFQFTPNFVSLFCKKRNKNKIVILRKMVGIFWNMRWLSPPVDLANFSGWSLKSLILTSWPKNFSNFKAYYLPMKAELVIPTNFRHRFVLVDFYFWFRRFSLPGLLTLKLIHTVDE